MFLIPERRGPREKIVTNSWDPIDESVSQSGLIKTESYFRSYGRKTFPNLVRVLRRKELKNDNGHFVRHRFRVTLIDLSRRTREDGFLNDTFVPNSL